MWPPASPYVAMPPPQQTPPLPPGQGGGYGGGGVVVGASPDSSQHSYPQASYDQQQSAYAQQHMYHQQGQADYMQPHHPSPQGGPPPPTSTPYGDARTPHGGYLAPHHQQQTPMYDQPPPGADYGQAAHQHHQMNYGHHQQPGPPPSSYSQQSPPGGGGGGGMYHSGTPVDYAQQQQQYATAGGPGGGGHMGYAHTPGGGGYGDGGYYTTQQAQTGYGGTAGSTPTTAGTPGVGGRGGGGYDQSGPYGMMAPPQPSPSAPMRPADPELVKRIHTIAEYCCRNPEMEELIRQRDGADPRFAFINGGEGYDYFRYAISCLQQGIELPSPTVDPLHADVALDGSGRAGGGGARPGRSLDSTQMAPSSSSAGAGEGGAGGGGGGQEEITREFDIDSLVMQYQEPPEPGSLGDALDKELNDVLQSVENQATSTAIRNGRHWIEVNGGTSVESANLLAFALRRKQSTLALSFLHKLNILYLVHDVVQNEFVHKKGSFLVTAFKPYLVWMLRDAYQAAVKEQDSVEKVKKILSLWVKRGIIDEDEQEEMGFLMSSQVDLERRGGGAGGGSHAPDTDKPGGEINSTPGRGEYDGIMGGFRPDGEPGSLLGNHSRPPPGLLKGSPYSFHDASGMIGGGHAPPPPGSRGSSSAGSAGGFHRGGGGFDRRPDDLEYTPESIPVGMMATMLRSMSKRAKNMQTAFVPYRPLDPLTTPQQLPPLEPPSDYLLDRLQEFYEDLEEIEEKLQRRAERDGRSRSRSPRTSGSKGKESSLENGERTGKRRSNSSSRSPSISGRRRRDFSTSTSRSRSHSRDLSPGACLAGRLQERDRERRIREFGDRGGGGGGGGLGSLHFEKSSSSSSTTTSSWVNAEMGIGDDGSFSGHPELRGARLGLGAASEVEERLEQRNQPPPKTDDPFELYRRQRAGKYHDVIATSKAVARLERLADKTCYVCHKIGHIARDCPNKLSR